MCFINFHAKSVDCLSLDDGSLVKSFRVKMELDSLFDTICATPDDNLLSSGFGKPVCWKLDLDKMEETVVYSGDDDPHFGGSRYAESTGNTVVVWGITTSPTGRHDILGSNMRVFSWCDDGLLTLVTHNTDTVFNDPFSSTRVSKDGKRILQIDVFGGKVVEIDIDSGFVRSSKFSEPPSWEDDTISCVSDTNRDDGWLLVCTGKDIWRFNPATGARTKCFSAPIEPEQETMLRIGHLSVSPDGERIVAFSTHSFWVLQSTETKFAWLQICAAASVSATGPFLEPID